MPGTIAINQMQRVAYLVEQITYKPGTKFRILPTIGMDGSLANRSVLYITVKMHNLDGSAQLIDITSPVELDHDRFEVMSDKDIYSMIFRKIVALEKHEATEWFRVDGVNFVDPHPELKTQGA